MSYQEAMGMNEMLEASEKKLAEAKQATIDVLERYGEGSKEHERALKKEDDITRGLAYTTRNANMDMGDFSFFTVMVASNIIGSLVPALSK